MALCDMARSYRVCAVVGRAASSDESWSFLSLKTRQLLTPAEALARDAQQTRLIRRTSHAFSIADQFDEARPHQLKHLDVGLSMAAANMCVRWRM